MVEKSLDFFSLIGDIPDISKRNTINIAEKIKTWQVESENDLITNLNHFETMKTVSKMSKEYCLPVICVGPTGVGKTLFSRLWFQTILNEKIEEISKLSFYIGIKSLQVLKQKITENCFKEINASDKRTAKHLEERLHSFLNRDLPEYSILPKFVLLDEIGSFESPFPKDAQYWLLNCIQSYKNVQFVLTSNFVELIPELQSRLLVLNFGLMHENDAPKPLKIIETKFGVSFESLQNDEKEDSEKKIISDWSKELVYCSHGDVRSFLKITRQLIMIAKSNGRNVIKKEDLKCFIDTSHHVTLESVHQLFKIISNGLCQNKSTILSKLHQYNLQFSNKGGDPMIFLDSLLNYYSTQNIEQKLKPIADNIFSNCLYLRNESREKIIKWEMVFSCIYKAFLK